MSGIFKGIGTPVTKALGVDPITNSLGLDDKFEKQRKKVFDPEPVKSTPKQKQKQTIGVL